MKMDPVQKMISSKHQKLSYRILTCDMEEGDYYVYDKDEGCYVNGDEGSDYEFDESDFNQQIDLNQQLDYKFDNLDWGYSDSKVRRCSSPTVGRQRQPCYLSSVMLLHVASVMTSW